MAVFRLPGAFRLSAPSIACRPYSLSPQASKEDRKANQAVLKLLDENPPSIQSQAPLRADLLRPLNDQLSQPTPSRSPGPSSRPRPSLESSSMLIDAFVVAALMSPIVYYFMDA
ncbi:MAG: hypothetical protein ACOYKZ_04290 [Chlamydiia bacterium]